MKYQNSLDCEADCVFADAFQACMVQLGRGIIVKKAARPGHHHKQSLQHFLGIF